MAKSKTAEVFDLDIESALQAHLLVNGNPRRATRSATKQAPPTPPAENESQQVPDDTPKTTRALRTTRKPTVKTAEAEAKKAALKKPRGKKAATSTKGEAVRVPSPALEIEPTLESDGESSSELSSARSMSFVPSEFGSVDEPLTPSTLGKIASSEVDGMEIEAAQNEVSTSMSRIVTKANICRTGF